MNMSRAPISVERWPTEMPLLVLVALSAGAIWVLLAVSIIGIIYALMLGAFFFFGHLIFISFVRGNAVKLGPDQFPHIHDRVRAIAADVGLRQPPDAYIMQAGGSLNALATKFLRSNFIVLFSDLLDACGDNTEARDLIVAHEVGHLKAGHLRWMWFLLPGFLVPFLGSALSRAREYTADRYGYAICSNKVAAMTGLGILAAGGKHGPKVNLKALVAQGNDLDTGFMTLGQWLATHPPLAHRIAALDPTIHPEMRAGQRGAARALVGLVLVAAVFMMSSIFVLGWVMPAFKRTLDEAQAIAAADAAGEITPTRRVVYEARARFEMSQLAAWLDEYARHSTLPADPNELNREWLAAKPGEEFPSDPFDGQWYGYETAEGAYVLWSAGGDLSSEADDIVYDSRIAGFR